MSLLIKALNKAEEKAQAQTAKTEQAKAELEQAVQSTVKSAVTKKKSVENVDAIKIKESDLELSLSPTNSMLVDPVSVADTSPKKIDSPSVSSGRPSQNNPSASSISAKSAANVFSSKGMDPRNQNKTLAIIAGASLLALLGMGFYYYQFFNQPEVVIPPKPILQSTTTVPESTAIVATEEHDQTLLAEEINDAEQTIQTVNNEIEPPNQAEVANAQEALAKKPAKKMLNNLALAENEEAENKEIEAPINENELIEEAPQVTLNRTFEKPKRRLMGDAIASESASIEVTKSNPQAGINPTLMSAYEAYNAGNDVEAQKLYKQVLQRDIRNLDALLGLGAIASRQGRIADANGWYGKVLEIEPRNGMAQSALLDNQLQISAAQGNTQETESRLKNMLAKQPNDTNLHIALGNYYAERNQWSSAQQAYFDAYSLNASADNAFNLAVSLDHLGKTKLALPYYQRALELASSNSNIDKAALEARIAAIQ
jgi:Tfp pilus assembly protein PilF